MSFKEIKSKEGEDITFEELRPEVKMNKWGDETYLRVWSDDEVEKAKKVGEKVVSKSKDNKKEYHIYEKTAEELGSDDSGIEYEILLNEKPDTNIIELKIETKDLDFHYQPELTQEETDAEINRPVNITGSYAVYHTTKKDYIVGQTNYMAGKAFHIYRPELIDDNGDRVWADMNIADGLLTITMPHEWLDNATYPVIVDPTFGYTSIGGTSTFSSSSDMYIFQYSIGENGTGQSISLYADDLSDYGDPFKLGIYEDDEGEPGAYIDTTGAESPPAGAAWLTSNLVGSPSLISGNTYWITVYTSRKLFYSFYDSVTSEWRIKIEGNYPTYPDPPTGLSGGPTRKFSAYVTYTTGEPPASTFIPTIIIT